MLYAGFFFASPTSTPASTSTFMSESSISGLATSGASTMFRRTTPHNIKSVKLWRNWLDHGIANMYRFYVPLDLKFFNGPSIYAYVDEIS